MGIVAKQPNTMMVETVLAGRCLSSTGVPMMKMVLVGNLSAADGNDGESQHRGCKCRGRYEDEDGCDQENYVGYGAHDAE